METHKQPGSEGWAFDWNRLDTPDPAADIPQNETVPIHSHTIHYYPSPSGSGATQNNGFSEMEPSHELPRDGRMSTVSTASVTSSFVDESANNEIAANLDEVNAIRFLLLERNIHQQALQEIARKYLDAVEGIKVRDLKIYGMAIQLSTLESEVSQLKSAQLEQLKEERSRMSHLDHQVEAMFRELDGQLRPVVMKTRKWHNQKLGSHQGQAQNTLEVPSSISASLPQNVDQNSLLGGCEQMFENVKRSISTMSRLLDEVRAGPPFIHLNPRPLGSTVALPTQFNQFNRNQVIIVRTEQTNLQAMNASLGQRNGNTAPGSSAVSTVGPSEVWNISEDTIAVPIQQQISGASGNSGVLPHSPPIQNRDPPQGRKLPSIISRRRSASEKTDTDATMITCPKCLKQYKTKHSLTRHNRLAHQRGKFGCKVCGKGYEYEKNFLKHKCKLTVVPVAI